VTTGLVVVCRQIVPVAAEPANPTEHQLGGVPLPCGQFPRVDAQGLECGVPTAEELGCRRSETSIFPRHTASWLRIAGPVNGPCCHASRRMLVELTGWQGAGPC
jgi:hypothetical protein